MSEIDCDSSLAAYVYEHNQYPAIRDLNSRNKIWLIVGTTHYLRRVEGALTSMIRLRWLVILTYGRLLVASALNSGH